MAKLHKPESLQTSPMQSLQARATFLLLHLFVYQHRCHSETKLQPVDTKPLTQTQTLNMLEGLDSSLKPRRIVGDTDVTHFPGALQGLKGLPRRSPALRPVLGL